MDLIDYIFKVAGASDMVIEKLFNLALHPPISTISLDDVVSGKTYLQPRIEYLDIDLVNRAVSRDDGYKFFLALDLILGLTPPNILEAIKGSKSKAEAIREIAEDIAGRVKTMENLGSSRFRGEDEKKEEIMMIAPSENVLGGVRGNWDWWIWKRYDRDGEESPNASKLLREVLSLANTLKDNGVRVTLITDEGYSYPHEIYEFNVAAIRLPHGLAKVIYVRDQSVTWFEHPIIGNMALDFRRGEEDVINGIYHRLGLKPVFRVRWAVNGSMLIRAYMEGGNFFIVKTEKGVALLTGVGVRGSNWATFRALAEILPEDIRLFGVPLAGYIRDWSSGAVHLDVVFHYLGDVGGERLALVDPSRIGFYSILEYERRTGSFRVLELLRLMKELDVKVDEPPREGQSPITMANLLNLGGGKVLADSFNEDVNRYLERVYGVEVIRISIPQLEAGGGGARCATRELWRS